MSTMETLDELEGLRERLRQAERRSRTAALALCLAVLAGIASAARRQEESPVLRVRGLIVEDAEGRPRIVLGAPVPELAGRRYPGMPVMGNPHVQDGVMVWDVLEGAQAAPLNGMVLLDERGYDRVVVGDPMPDPAIRERIYPRQARSWGVQINDPDRTERSGYGVFETGQVTLGLDWVGREAVLLYGLADGRAGIQLHARDGASTAEITADAGSGPARLQLSGTPSLVELRDAGGSVVERIPE